jgi:LmbE family N-acetylglucosaminyl deacetylase
MNGPGTLCVLAHQDDEMAMATRIAFEIRAGRSIHCVVLTDGATRNASALVRDAESLTVLTRLGVAPDNVVFLGSCHGIRDGMLVQSLDRALALLDEHLGVTPIDRIFCMAWEGGHPDHDASHLVALALGRRRGLLDRIWEFSLYNGRGTRGPFFRVMAPLATGARRQQRRLTLSEATRVARLPVCYRSQRSTWLGLFPEAFLKLVILRREIMQEAAADRVRGRPHDGKLFYERRFGVDYRSWRALAEPFITRHLSREISRPSPLGG